jgi:acetyl esterase/lipase
MARLVWFHGGGFIGGDLDAHEADTVSLELAVGRCTTHQFR